MAGAPVVGMRGSGSFVTTGQRPESWRQQILRLYPNGHAPLTAIMSMLDSEVVTDPVYHWFQQDLPDFRIFCDKAGHHTAGDFVLTVDDGAGTGMARKCVRGSVIIVESTREVMQVTLDPANDTEITVRRGCGEVAAAQIDNNMALYIFTSAFEQGSMIPTSLAFDPTECKNYTQIMRVSLSQTRTGMRTLLRTGDAYEKAKKDALDMISIQMENAFILGQLGSTTQNGQLKLMTRGLRQWMIGDSDCSCEGVNVWTSGDTFMSKAQLNAVLERMFLYGSTNKLCLAGAGFLATVNELVEGTLTTTNVVAGDSAYGMQMTRWITPFGIVHFKLHPLMSIHPLYTFDAMFLDMDFLKYRYIDDLNFITHRQENGTDGRMDEFIVECGLEMHHCKAHALIKNAQCAGTAPT